MNITYLINFVLYSEKGISHRDGRTVSTAALYLVISVIVTSGRHQLNYAIRYFMKFKSLEVSKCTFPVT